MNGTKLILLSAALTAIINVGLLSAYPVYAVEGECKSVTCFDGSVHPCGFDCSKLVGGGGGGGGGGGFSPTQQAFVNEMSKAIHMLFGDPQQNAEELQRQQRERQRAIEEARRRAEEARRKLKKDQERRRKEFEESKRRMLGTMRGTLTGPLKPRDLSGLPVLEVGEVEGPFGIRTLKPRDLSTSLATESQDPDYSANVPEIHDRPIVEKNEQAEIFKKQTLVMSTLFNKVSQQMKDYLAVQKSVTQTEEKVEKAKKRVEEAKIKVEELKAQIQEPPQEVTDNEIPVPDQKIEDKRALQEALEALREAEEVFDTNEQELAELVSEKEEMEKQIQDTRDLFADVKENPDSLDELYKEYSSEAEKGEE